MNDFSSGNRSEVTCGDFKTEEEACQFFDSILCDHPELFTLYAEVEGKMIFHPFWKDEKTNLRIDRILVPQRKLVQAGWDMGMVGVEIKCSGKKIGPPLAQAMDYLNAVWFITPAQLAVHVSHVFVFPCGELFNNIGSVCAQNHLGQVEITHYKIHFRTGQRTILYYNITTGDIQINENCNGKKVGSR